MDFNELKTTITENESKNILNMFETLLKEQPNYLKDGRASSVKETIDQACFISLGLDGVADGIFFPNAQFNFIHMKREFICLCIYKNKPAICYTHEKFEDYFIEYLEDITFSIEEIRERERLTRQHKENENCIKLLKSIKRVKKSDQSDYKIVNKNFTSSLDFFTMKIDYNAIQISAIERLENNTSNYCSDRLYIKNYQNLNDDQINADCIMSTINEYITTYIENNKTIEAKLKCLHQEALKVEKIFNNLLTSTNNLLNKKLLHEYITRNAYKLCK